MSPVTRVSPVRFDVRAEETEDRRGWRVVLRYEDEGDGPWLVDLSHRARWDFQDGDLEARRPLDREVPAEPGAVAIQGALAINRLNRTQVALWHLGEGEPPATPDEVGFTDITDGECMLAVVGSGTPAVMEHARAPDLFDPARSRPSVTQGPVLGIPCRVVTFAEDLVALTFSRGYGQSFAEALLASAAPTGLRPGGEGVFARRFAQLEGGS